MLFRTIVSNVKAEDILNTSATMKALGLAQNTEVTSANDIRGDWMSEESLSGLNLLVRIRQLKARLDGSTCVQFLTSCE